MKKDHVLNSDAQQAFIDKFNEVARSHDKWMAALWCIEDGMVVLKQRTTYQFPGGDMLPAVGMLATHLHETLFDEAQKKQAELEKPDPLPEVFPRQWMPDDELPNTQPSAKGTVTSELKEDPKLSCIDACIDHGVNILEEIPLESIPANPDAIIPDDLVGKPVSDDLDGTPPPPQQEAD